MKESMAISGNAAIIAFNEKVVARNARMDDYEKRRITLKKKRMPLMPLLKNYSFSIIISY